MTPNLSILRDWYTRVWENSDLDAMDELLLQNTENSHAGGYSLIPNLVSEPNELREWITVFNSLVEDIRVTFVRTTEQGDWISVMMEIHCRQIGTDKTICVNQQVTARIAGDRIAESYPAFDFIRFFEQLGQLPADCHALLLTGTRLH
ncbi:nuclear transport factor 2 family protein [uncultured Roseobacter sp.]|uniref:nuclear transport factor 2 family protein n=1 Tax=uncultured Roseobacter sp. TaxID=114847 RepID=UPI002613B45A|nr:nuclear transport factor 2 family protein [uncultured Roseobacter sp.]